MAFDPGRRPCRPCPGLTLCCPLRGAEMSALPTAASLVVAAYEAAEERTFRYQRLAIDSGNGSTILISKPYAALFGLDPNASGPQQVSCEPA